MKRLFIPLFILCFGISAVAQESTENTEKFEFTTVTEVPITSIKNQSSSGTCWSFSGLALIEAELLRKGKGEHDLSAMYIARRNYEDKAVKNMRMHGTNNFGGGGSFADVLEAIRDYGIVPTEVYTGLNYGDTIHRHAELDNILSSFMNSVIKNKKLTTAWFDAYNGILDAYLGFVPETFEYDGAKYTPLSFAENLEINTDDYISITSFTHHPFYTAFPVEVPDNWRWALSYNLPLNEMIEVINNAIENGYTVAWATDVSEKGFNRSGIAVVPDVKQKEEPGSDQAHWLGISKEELEKRATNLNAPMPEMQITQEMRQIGFNNYETTDDHGMLIYGIAKDQNDTPYYMVKNSWGTSNPYKGTWYASVPFVEYKTISIVVNKEALPKDIKNKLLIK